MPLSVAAMCNSLRLVTGEAIELFPNDGDGGAISYLNKSLWELMEKIPFRSKEKTVYFDTVAGTYNYELPTVFEAVRDISITDDYDKRTWLILRDVHDFDENFEEEEASWSYPTHYMREGDCIKLQPIPSDIWKITLRYNRTVDDLETELEVPAVPDHITELIELGAKYRRLLDKGQVEKAEGFMRLQEKMLASYMPQDAKEKTDTRLSGLQAIRPEYNLR